MRQHILHGGLHRMGSHLNHIFDNERFLGIDPYDMLWMTGKEMPLANVIKNDKAYELKVALPGFKKEEIELSINGNVLMMSAEKKTPSSEQATVHRSEFEQQRTRRQFRLPDNVDIDTIHAWFVDGLLHIQMLYEDIVSHRTIRIN